MKNFWRIAVYFFVILGAWIPFAWLSAIYLAIEKPLAKADAILILAGSATYIERTQKAAVIFKEGVASKIFLTNDGLRGGWSKEEQRNPYFTERARWELIQQGIPEQAIEILPTPLTGTYDEANHFVKVSAERKLKSLLLVTSAYHTRRALRTFKREFAKENLPIEIGIESAPLGIQTPKPYAWWLSSNGWKSVAGEYVKTFYYWLFY
jgi:uncharacterized SAM-binding protein YcdF (DUF218 family)